MYKFCECNGYVNLVSALCTQEISCYLHAKITSHVSIPKIPPQQKTRPLHFLARASLLSPDLVGTRGFEPPTPCTPCRCAKPDCATSRESCISFVNADILAQNSHSSSFRSILTTISALCFAVSCPVKILHHVSRYFTHYNSRFMITKNTFGSNVVRTANISLISQPSAPHLFRSSSTSAVFAAAPFDF